MSLVCLLLYTTDTGRMVASSYTYRPQNSRDVSIIGRSSICSSGSNSGVVLVVVAVAIT